MICPEFGENTQGRICNWYPSNRLKTQAWLCLRTKQINPKTRCHLTNTTIRDAAEGVRQYDTTRVDITLHTDRTERNKLFFSLFKPQKTTGQTVHRLEMLEPGRLFAHDNTSPWHVMILRFSLSVSVDALQTCPLLPTIPFKRDGAYQYKHHHPRCQRQMVRQ